jgi:beta-fructofuranosidase
MTCETQPVLDSRERLAADTHRPQYHFLPPSNWMNDPNGLIQWRGQYHLFYQYNPYAPVWGSIHWGHAISDDLVHWRDLPIALAPTPGGVDEYGVFSGCAVDDNGVPTLMYTGVRKHADGSRTELPCLATSSDDDLRTWQKYRQNPVIASPPLGVDVLGFRDHSVWNENGTWYQLIGSGIRDVGGTVFLYRSADLRHWEYVHPILIGDTNQTGNMWECPDLFRLGDEHILVVSPIPQRRSLYFWGGFDDHRFSPRGQAVLDDGGYLYAPQSFTDSQGRRIMFGWFWEGRDESAQCAAGWAGVMSLPRLFVSRADGRLGMEPVPELRSLRGQSTSMRDVALNPYVRADLVGAALEIAAMIEPGSASHVGLKVRRSPDGAEQTAIVYEPATDRLIIDRQHSSLDPSVQREEHGARLGLTSGEALRLQVFVDHSVIEVFANGHTTLTSRIYPTRSDSLGVELVAQGGSAQLSSLDIWEMAAIWPRG